MSMSRLMSKTIQAGPKLNHQEFRFLVLMADCPYGPNEYRCDTDAIASNGRFHWLDIQDLRASFHASRVAQEMGIEVRINDGLSWVVFREGQQ